MQKISMEKSSFQSSYSIKCFLNLMFKLFFKYLDDFLVLWMDNLLIFNETKEHLHAYNKSLRNLEKQAVNWKCPNVNSLKLK